MSAELRGRSAPRAGQRGPGHVSGSSAGRAGDAAAAAAPLAAPLPGFDEFGEVAVL